jgi:hypothetical protein
MALTEDNNTNTADGAKRPPAVSEPWADFGLIYQFAFPHPEGLYLSFQAVVDGALFVVLVALI